MERIPEDVVGIGHAVQAEDPLLRYSPSGNPMPPAARKLGHDRKHASDHECLATPKGAYRTLFQCPFRPTLIGLSAWNSKEMSEIYVPIHCDR